MLRNLDSLRAQARAFDAKQQAEGLPRQMTLCAEPTPKSVYSVWRIAEQFNTRNVAQFREYLAAGRLDHIGYCLPTGRTGDFATIAEAWAWLESGRNVYANVEVR